MKRSARFFVPLSAVIAVLALVAYAVFGRGVPWLAGLNPHFALASWSSEDTTLTGITARTDAQGRDATLLSAFFGLDGGLWAISRYFVCPFAAHTDGMPVIFSHELDVHSLQPGDFRVVSRSGAIGTVACTTLAPASDTGELRTVLLAGEFGSETDQPVSVEIVGHVLSLDGSVTFQGARTGVIPLKDGPSITLAETVPEAQWRAGTPATRLPWGGGSGCPVGTRQAVRVTWEGGVTKPGGRDADQEDGQRYTVLLADGTERAPDALADLGDGDNNHLLCFEAASDLREVRFPAGHFTDPREDLNPDTAAPVGP